MNVKSKEGNRKSTSGKHHNNHCRQKLQWTKKIFFQFQSIPSNKTLIKEKMGRKLADTTLILPKVRITGNIHINVLTRNTLKRSHQYYGILNTDTYLYYQS